MDYTLISLLFVDRMLKSTHEWHVHKRSVRMTNGVLTAAAIFPAPTLLIVSRITIYITYLDDTVMTDMHPAKPARAETGAYSKMCYSTRY